MCIFMYTYTFFLKWMLMGVIFGLFFQVNSFEYLKMQSIAKRACAHKHFLALVRIFILNLHFFQVVLHGCPYSILLLKEFILIVKKCTRLQNQAHACTYKHIIWIVTFSASSYYTKGSRKKQGFFNGSAIKDFNPPPPTRD